MTDNDVVRCRMSILLALLVGGGTLVAAPTTTPAAGPTALTPAPTVQAAATDRAVRFFGTGSGSVDRLVIRLDAPSRPVDVGATDFTIEMWMRARAADNPAGPAPCTQAPDSHDDWIVGHVLVDRDRWVRGPGPQGRDFGVSIAGGRVVFGVANANDDGKAICGATNVLDDRWHHVAVQRRRNGLLEIWVDGRRDAWANAASGDVSYPNGATNGSPWDPYLVIGAEKHDAGAAYPSFSGKIDELRISTTRRYGTPFTPRRAPWATDAHTVGLYHFDRSSCGPVRDRSGATGGPSDAQCRFGGDPAGPVFVTDTPR